MKQILQDMANGTTSVTEAPSPQVKPKHLLIATTSSLISVGTEKMLVDFGKASYFEKARKQPDKVKMVLEKVQTDGLLTTIDAVQSKLSQPLPLGYSNVGVVTSVGAGVEGFKVGDRVLSNGPHADIVCVPQNLCAKIPSSVSNTEATFTVVASIGLQGIRLAQPTLGEAFVVTGVGLIGLLTVQLLKAHGCRVLAIDFDEQKLELARSFGAEICNLSKGEDPIESGFRFSRGKGVDGVIITASTKSNDPVSQAAKMSRKRGRIVLVGVTGLELSRADFYEKELSFQVSCSYGPGRYDPAYEEKGQDYPYGFVRWTEQRNFEAVLDMMDSGGIKTKQLVTHNFEFEEAPKAYELLMSDSSALGVILNYNSKIEERVKPTVILKNDKLIAEKPVLGFVGAGNYASRMLIPAFKVNGAQLKAISTAGGVNSIVHGKKLGFHEATTDTDGMIKNPQINTIAIVTRHNSHARFVISAIEAQKHIFVEKPLAINMNELDKIKSIYEDAKKQGQAKHLMVGFNRRFAPHIQKTKKLLKDIKQPKTFIFTMNAGLIPEDHWTQDPEVGGGRIIGEACHYIDLMRYLAGYKITSVYSRRMGDNDSMKITEDKAVITLGFADGSFGSINYLANGSSSFPKERIEVFVAGKVLQVDNFRKMKGFGWKGFKKLNLWKQDKGQENCVKEFLKSIEAGVPCPITDDEIFEVARVSIEVAKQLREQR